MFLQRSLEARIRRLRRQQHMPFCRDFLQALFRTRTGDPLLTMEVAVGSYGMPRRRLLVRFPCNLRDFSVCRTISLKGPERP